MAQGKSYSYTYPRPALTVDAAVFCLNRNGYLKVLLIQRKAEPFINFWALPGGFVDVGESAEDAVQRELKEETSLRLISFEQVATFSKPDRDPREHVVTIAYIGFVKLEDHLVKCGSDAKNAAWFKLDDLPMLAFDHKKIIEVSLLKLRSMDYFAKIAPDLLPEKFPLSDLRTIYEQILGHSIDKRNFRRQVIAQGLVVELDEYEKDVQRWATRMYKFNSLR